MSSFHCLPQAPTPTRCRPLSWAPRCHHTQPCSQVDHSTARKKVHSRENEGSRAKGGRSDSCHQGKRSDLTLGKREMDRGPAGSQAAGCRLQARWAADARVAGTLCCGSIRVPQNMGHWGKEYRGDAEAGNSSRPVLDS